MTAGVAERLPTRSMLREGGDDDHVLISRMQLFISTDVLGFSFYPTIMVMVEDDGSMWGLQSGNGRKEGRNNLMEKSGISNVGHADQHIL